MNMSNQEYKNYVKFINILEIRHIILQLDRNKYLNNNSQAFKIVPIRIYFEGIRYAHALDNGRINTYLHT